MAKVRLYGETSGFVDLKAPDVANDVTITLPNTTGPFATETYADAAGVAGSGLVAVKSAIFTGTQTGSVAAGSNFAVTDLSITHEVADVSNKLIISAFLGAASQSIGVGRVGLAIHDGTGLIAVGASPGNRIPVTAGGTITEGQVASTEVVTMPSVCFVHTPGAGSKTYTVRAVNIAGTTRTVTVNRSESDTNSTESVRTVSSLVIQEVRV